ncbi:MAG: hypothetical protein WD669_10990 [Pirellulales bacterium]
MKGLTMSEGKKHSSFPRSAWERKAATLCVAGGIEWPQSGQAVRSHAERGNERAERGNERWSSPVPSPQPPARRGISLTEVLIAMGILTLGLLGVMSMFPVGSYYMQQAEIADRGSAVARAAMSDVIARGMLDSRAWRTVSPSGVNFNVNSDAAPALTFGRSVGKAMALEPDQSPKNLAYKFGSAFVIDPLGIAGTSFYGSYANNWRVSPFPAAAYYYPVNYGSYASTKQWLTWTPAAGGQAAPELWPIRRVTFSQPRPGSPTQLIRMEMPVAESMFRGVDDLAFDIPTQGDLPAVQPWDLRGTAPLERQWVGDYSWIVTIVPTSSDAQIALGRDPQSYSYDVSVVVFYKRVMPSKSPKDNNDAKEPINELSPREPMVEAHIVSTGLNGGEVLLEKLPSSAVPDPFGQLRAGQWVMLCGPHPVSSDAAPRFVLNWYQVMAVDGVKERLNVSGTTSPPPAASDPERRLLALRGPEWPWQPAATPTSSELSNDLCVGVFPGAVAVHKKTMRLEGPRGAAMGGGFAWGTAPTTQSNPFVLDNSQ